MPRPPHVPLDVRDIQTVRTCRKLVAISVLGALLVAVLVEVVASHETPSDAHALAQSAPTNQSTASG